MRKKQVSAGVTVNAVAGTHVVLLGLDLADAAREDCLGFAVQREDCTEHQVYWMKGTKTFKETDPGLGFNTQVSSREHPFQTFVWEDYSCKPRHDYTYTVVPLYGQPQQLREGTAVPVHVSTESEFGQRHSVFFNRGAVASQEYARRFLDRSPDEVGEEAYCWLSRGLLEAFVQFVGQAQGPDYGLFGAVYEFQWPAALKALKAASDTGASVRVLYDGIPGATGPLEKNQAAIADAGIETLCVPRTIGKIMHNKFFVLTKRDRPIAVWTGSTNLTENGIFGHSNCGHVIEDPAIAAAYLAYWHELKDCRDCKVERTWMKENNAAPPDPWDDDLTAVFSPRTGLEVLQWYADIAGRATGALFMTFAFGMHESFQKVYERKDGLLRFALMEKEGNGRGLEQGKKDIRRIRRLPNVVVAVGNSIALNCFDRWLAERRALSNESNVRYIHTKYMLVDPLGEHPIVVSGSANFSAASTNANNENMVVIRDDPRVADIYLGEFMRLHTHYAFREAVANSKTWNKGKPWHPNWLKPDDSWQRDYFTPGHQRFLRRQYFAGA